jgi:hypothetical protein
LKDSILKSLTGLVSYFPELKVVPFGVEMKGGQRHNDEEIVETSQNGSVNTWDQFYKELFWLLYKNYGVSL